MMDVALEPGNRTVAIALTEEELAKLEACAAYRSKSIHEVVRHYLNDWISVDYPASTGTFSRRQLYRD
jgi:hypothetical protein